MRFKIYIYMLRQHLECCLKIKLSFTQHSISFINYVDGFYIITICIYKNLDQGEIPQLFFKILVIFQHVYILEFWPGRNSTTFFIYFGDFFSMYIYENFDQGEIPQLFSLFLVVFSAHTYTRILTRDKFYNFFSLILVIFSARIYTRILIRGKFHNFFSLILVIFQHVYIYIYENFVHG